MLKGIPAIQPSLIWCLSTLVLVWFSSRWPLITKPLYRLCQEKRAKKLPKRHHLPEGDYSKYDGSVDVEVIQQKLRFSKEDILLATNPEYDGSAGEETKKRRFVVLEILYPCLTKEIRIAALGGHSKEVFAPPGHYLLGKKSIRQLAPLTHHTSATKDITQAGFLSQQDRREV